ncbi:MAG: hypothetical protein HY769_04950 [Candidatus Stahlbacteria bacterium]|nr:hypothetical protein [Candidatus Stahlbacteria bacterium]
MLAVKGLFDGKRIKLLEKVQVKETQEVIITFLGADEHSSTDESKALHRGIYKLAETGRSFDFLNSSEEDIYSDDDLKVRYKNDLRE